jgi:hypothetical protein
LRAGIPTPAVFALPPKTAHNRREGPEMRCLLFVALVEACLNERFLGHGGNSIASVSS